MYRQHRFLLSFSGGKYRHSYDLANSGGKYRHSYDLALVEVIIDTDMT